MLTVDEIVRNPEAVGPAMVQLVTDHQQRLNAAYAVKLGIVPARCANTGPAGDKRFYGDEKRGL